jgi:hypothetical protein
LRSNVGGCLLEFGLDGLYRRLLAQPWHQSASASPLATALASRQLKETDSGDATGGN